MPGNETADRWERARAPERAERLEMIFALASQGLVDCPNWVAMAYEECDRADCTPAMDTGRCRERKEG